MKRADFDYDLPPERIAQQARPRGQSRMMVIEPGIAEPTISHQSFQSFPDLMHPGEVLVLNDTQVFPARLHAKPKPGMQRPIEILLTRQRALLTWECWCRPARRVRSGDVLEFSSELKAEVLDRREGTLLIRFLLEEGAEGESIFWQAVDQLGEAPLPPYIHSGLAKDEARESYQTVYAARRGAVAAPTAGLHFSPEILDRVEQKGIELVKLTLHVGPGTFRPVDVEEIAEHRMDPEVYEISEESAGRLNAAITEHRRIVAVGTTSVRTLEAAIVRGNGRIPAGGAETDLFITPGYRFRVVDALLTNFHLPRSTLLMLVSAFAGMQTIRTAYREAIDEGYLFYSFGDCMFLARRAP